jgi:methionyl-tRNA formyltransferase
MEARVPITDATTTGDLHDVLAEVGAKLMVLAMDELEHRQPEFARQSGIEATYAAKIENSEAHIAWSRPAYRVLRHIHGLSPFPGAWCEMPIGGQAVRVKILRCELANGDGPPGALLDDQLTIACGQGAIRILELQKAGGAPMKAKAFQAGARLRPPLRLV